MTEDKWHRNEQRIISIIEKFTTYKNWISFMHLSIEAKIDHQTLTNHIDLLIKRGAIVEYRGKNKSRLFCISGHSEDIEYNEQFRDFTQRDQEEAIRATRLVYSRNKKNSNIKF